MSWAERVVCSNIRMHKTDLSVHLTVVNLKPTTRQLEVASSDI